MEALADNLMSNLPKDSLNNLSEKEPQEEEPGTGSSRTSNGSTDGWDVPHSVVQTAVQEMPLKLHIADRLPTSPRDAISRAHFANGDQHPPASRPVEDAATAAQGSCANSQRLTVPEESNGNCQAAHRATYQTNVITRTLDWRDAVLDLHPPFDVLLVADVVRSE